GVAHAHVDDVLARAARRHLQLVGDVEDVGRKTLDSGKLSHVARDFLRSAAGFPSRAALQKVIMLPDTYSTGKLETASRSRDRQERHHRLWRALRDGQPTEVRTKPGGTARAHPPGLAAEPIR